MSSSPRGLRNSGGSLPELRSPRGDEDIRVHPGWCIDGLAMAKTSGKFFVIDQELHAVMAGRMTTCDLRAAVTKDGKVIAWPIPKDSKVLREAADKATSEWTCVTWDIKAKDHGHQPATKQHGEPKWGFDSFADLLDVAVNGRILTSPDDETVKKILAKKMRRGKK